MIFLLMMKVTKYKKTMSYIAMGVIAILTVSLMEPLMPANATTCPGPIYCHITVGAQGSSDAGGASAFRSLIRVVYPQTITDAANVSFWVASDLNCCNNYLQVGYLIYSTEQSSPRWFFEYWVGTTRVNFIEGDPGSAIDKGGSNNWYKGEHSSGFTWGLWSDGFMLGSQNTNSDGTSTIYGPKVAAEVVDSTVKPGTSQLGPVTYFPALNTFKSGAWYTPVDATSIWEINDVSDKPNVCPPYGILVGGTNQLKMGSGQTCSPPSPLW